MIWTAETADNVEFDSDDIAVAAHEGECYEKALEALRSGAECDYRSVEGA